MIGDFLVAFLVLGGLFWALFSWSRNRDAQDVRRRAAAERAEQAVAAEEARKFRAGVALVCLGCGERFQGPLTEMGCPSCHLSALVMTEAQYAQASAGTPPPSRPWRPSDE